MLRLEITSGGWDRGEGGATSAISGSERAAEGWHGGDPGDAADLRRRRKAEQIELVLQRASALATPDRTLLEWVLRDGRTAIQVAQVTREPARVVRRRVRRLMQRVHSLEFLFVVRERERWPATRRRVADACVVGGRSMNQASKELRLSFHSVRRHLEAIAVAFEAIHPNKAWSTPVGFRRERNMPHAAEGGGT